MQEKHNQWGWQWDHLQYDNDWLFIEWILPNTLEDFRGKTVLDCGSGSGQHFEYIATLAKNVTGVDLNISETARKKQQSLSNVALREEDLAIMNLGQSFDIVYCIGVLHHTDNPTATFRNIAKHCTPGGRVIVWVYSREGNWMNRFIVEPMKSVLIHSLPRSIVLWIARILTALLYIPIYSVYLLPLPFLPFYEYFQNWRKLSYTMNVLNVFDKLNAPQTWFLSETDLKSWFNEQEFSNVHISRYKGVSWRGSGTKR